MSRSHPLDDLRVGGRIVANCKSEISCFARTDQAPGRPPLRSRDRKSRGEEHVNTVEGAVELLCGEHPSLSRVRVTVSPRTLAVHQALADLFAEALRLVFEAFLVDGVGLSAEDEPLRVQRVQQIGDLDLAHL